MYELPMVIGTKIINKLVTSGLVKKKMERGEIKCHI